MFVDKKAQSILSIDVQPQTEAKLGEITKRIISLKQELQNDYARVGGATS